MKITRIISVFTLCALWTGAALAQSALKVGVTPNMPPFIYKEAGQYAGLEADLARRLGKELGRDIEFVEVDWLDQIPALVEGRTDIVMSGMTITKKRLMQISFSDPYFMVGQIGLVRIKDQDMYLTLPYLKSKKTRVGVEKGTTGEMIIQGKIPNQKSWSYDTPEQATEALRKKRIDVFVHDSPVIWNVLSKDYANEFSVAKGALSTEYLGWGVRRNDEQLLANVNRILKQWEQNGEIDAAIKRWMPFLDAINSDGS